MQGNGMITPTLQVRAGSPLHTKKAKSAGRYLQLGGSAPLTLGAVVPYLSGLFYSLGSLSLAAWGRGANYLGGRAVLPTAK